MSRYDPRGFYDGFSVITQGINSGLAPVSLGRNQLAFAVNTTFRLGYATQRPGWIKRSLTFSDPDDEGVESLFENNIFQGAAAFERRNQIVTMIGGRLFRITVDDWEVMDVSTVGDLNPSNRYRAWFTEAEDFLICQDGQSAPWLYDGATAVRSDTFGVNGARQVPAGQSMVYSGGRLVTTLADPTQFVVGDIVGGDSGTPAYNFRDAVLYFTENEIVSGGGAFSTPINAGPITALRPVAQIDTSTGQGPTQVFTTSGVFSLNAPTERALWGTTNFPLGTVSMVQAGALSDRATVNVNGDIWFRALDGIRSFIVARRDFSSWVNAPMSREMSRILDRDDRNLLGYSSAALFDNRMLMTVQPYRKWGHGIVHRGLAVMDFAPLAFMNTRVNPVWEGAWCGVQILQVLTGTFKGIERCFMFVLNDDDDIELWEVTRDRLSDNVNGDDVRIEWAFETGGLTFPRGPQAYIGPGAEVQSLDGGELYVDSIDGTVTFNLQYRADQYPCWLDWHEWTICSTMELCGTPGSFECVTPLAYRQQYRKPMRLPTPDPSCDEVVNKTMNVGREFQVRFNITGACRIKMLEAVAHDVQENVNDLCAPNESCVSVSCCPVDDLEYAIPSPSVNTSGSDDDDGEEDDGDEEEGGGEDGGEDTELPAWPELVTPTGDSTYQPSITAPDGYGGDTHPIGIEPLSGEPVDGDPAVDGVTALEDGVLEQWAAAVWADWEAYKTTNGITVTYEEIFWVFNDSPGQLRWSANSIWGETVTWSTSTWSWEMWISYTEAV